MVIITLHLFLFRSFPTHHSSGTLPLDVTKYKKMTVTQKETKKMLMTTTTETVQYNQARKSR